MNARYSHVIRRIAFLVSQMNCLDICMCTHKKLISSTQIIFIEILLFEIYSAKKTIFQYSLNIQMLNVLKRFNLTRLFRMESNLTQLTSSSVVSEANLSKRPDENDEVAVKKQKLNDENQKNQTQPETQTNTDEQKIKKRKYALLIGYSGEGYYGLQRFFIA